MSTGVTAHMVVKNEDQWVWYAINSVLPHIDSFLITDTGSSDHTIEIIKSISSPKIIFNQVKILSREDVSKVRQSQIDNTKTKWFWIVDGDEVYSDTLAKEILEAISIDKYSAIVVRRHDLLGDIYHKQIETVGTYEMFGETGHLLIRLLNNDLLKGLVVKGQYPQESYYTLGDEKVNNLDKKKVYITKHSLYHAMYLKRSSLGGNLPMFNRGKYKVESGIQITDRVPKVFKLPRPKFVPDPFTRRGVGYEIVASVVTPIKNLKRKLL